MSFVFYDTETTGTDTHFDQILQFAAIKTNYELKELDRFEMRCRLLPYVVPSPGAILINGLGIERLLDPALPSHYQMVRAISSKLTAWSPGIFIGHNSIGFDEHLLRQAFYKTLHHPFLTNTNGNCRSCSLRMIQAVARFAPEALAVPVDQCFRQVFKLDRLAPANGFNHGAAHDAVADVEATIHLCRLIAERAPDLWSGFVRFAQKAAVVDFAGDQAVFALTEFYGGTPHSWMVSAIGINPDNKSEMLVFDLANDPEALGGMPDDQLVLRLGHSPKPVRGMRCNAGPVVFSYDDAPEDLRSAAPGIDELNRRAARLKVDGGLRARLVAAFLRARGVREPSIHVEQQIYDGFTGDDDKAIMLRFHEREWAERLSLTEQLADKRLRTLGQRLIFMEAPHVLPEAVRHDYAVAIAARLTSDDGEVPWLTYRRAIAEADDLLQDADAARGQLLRELRHYLAVRAEEAAMLAFQSAQ